MNKVINISVIKMINRIVDDAFFKASKTGISTSDMDKVERIMRYSKLHVAISIINRAEHYSISEMTEIANGRANNVYRFIGTRDLDAVDKSSLTTIDYLVSDRYRELCESERKNRLEIPTIFSNNRAAITLTIYNLTKMGFEEMSMSKIIEFIDRDISNNGIRKNKAKDIMQRKNLEDESFRNKQKDALCKGEFSDAFSTRPIVVVGKYSRNNPIDKENLDKIIARRHHGGSAMLPPINDADIQSACKDFNDSILKKRQAEFNKRCGIVPEKTNRVKHDIIELPLGMCVEYIKGASPIMSSELLDDITKQMSDYSKNVFLDSLPMQITPRHEDKNASRYTEPKICHQSIHEGIGEGSINMVIGETGSAKTTFVTLYLKSLLQKTEDKNPEKEVPLYRNPKVYNSSVYKDFTSEDKEPEKEVPLYMKPKQYNSSADNNNKRRKRRKRHLKHLNK